MNVEFHWLTRYLLLKKSCIKHLWQPPNWIVFLPLHFYRPDRKEFLDVYKNNVLADKWDQYEIAQASKIRALDKDIPYDYFSIMHYGKNLFAKTDANVSMKIGFDVWSKNVEFLEKKVELSVTSDAGSQNCCGRVGRSVQVLHFYGQMLRWWRSHISISPKIFTIIFSNSYIFIIWFSILFILAY